MEKPLLIALLFLCMHFPLFALRVPHSPSDTAAPIATTLVLPALSHALAPTGGLNTHTSTSPGASSSPPARIPLTIRIYNNSSRDLSNILLEWELQVNGVVRQKGTISQLIIAPQHSGLVRLPAKIPSGAGEEAFLGIRYRSRKKEPQIPANRIPPADQPRLNIPARDQPGLKVLAEEQLLLKTWDGYNGSVSPVGDLSFSDEDGIFTIHSPSLRVRFDKQTGWLQQYEIKGFRLLVDTPGLSPDFWQPPGDSSRQQATRAPRLQLFSTSTGSGIVIVRAEYLLPEIGCHLHISYTINAAGEMQVEQSMEADSTQKGWSLPRFGMQWTLPPSLDSVAWYGAGDAAIGIYRQTINEQGVTLAAATPAATAVRWWKITGREGKGFLITADSSLLNMSALRYAENPSLTQLHIDYPSTGPAGLGTPNSKTWPLHDLPYGNYHYSFKVTPVTPGP